MSRIQELCNTCLIIAWFLTTQPLALSQQSVLIPVPFEEKPFESDRSSIDDLRHDPRLACLRIPSSLFTTEAHERFQHSAPVDRVVLGTHVRGTALCSGEVRGELRDHVGGVEFVCWISGVVTSQTCGVNGPATIKSSSDTTYTAEKRILFDGRHLSSQPAKICATTRVQITGIDSTAPGLRGHLVRRVASRRAAESLPTAERITRQLTVIDLQQHIDEEFATRLASLNSKLAKRLSILDAFPRKNYKLSICSKAQFIEILLTHNDDTSIERSIQNRVKHNDRNPVVTFPAVANAVLWIQIPDVNLVGLDSIADWGFVKASSYFPLWLSTPLLNAKARVDARTPRVELLRHENWIGFQFEHDQQQ